MMKMMETDRIEQENDNSSELAALWNQHDICPEFCWDKKDYRGNQELIKLGAIPITEDWNGDVSKIPEKQEEVVQLSLFD